jgi:hypothetical protein
VKESYIRFTYDYSIPPSGIENGDDDPSVLEMERFTLSRITGRETSIGEASLWITVSSNVAVSIYDVQGRLVGSLFSGTLPVAVASSVYFCKATVNGKSKALKIVIVK